MKSVKEWQTIVKYLPEDFETLAKEHKVLEVQYGDAKITSGSDLLRMILLHAGVGFGLRQTVVQIAEAGGPDVSHVTLHKKMRLSAPYLRALVARLSSESTEAAPERWAGYEVTAIDATTFSSPGADGTDARAHVQLRLADLEVVGVIIADQSVGETFKRFTWRPGQLALADRGYANPPGIVSVVDQGADVLVRVNRAALPMTTRSAVPIELMTWLRSLKGYDPRERPVSIYSREHKRTINGRLIAVRLPEAAAQQARVRVRRELGSKTTELDLEVAHYVVLFTTVPLERMSPEKCLALYRLRWQVELAFKRWKSICHFDRLPNFRDDTILTWLYAKLLLALLMHRMSSGASTLFPPEDQAGDALVQDAMEGSDDHVARPRRSAAAA